MIPANYDERIDEKFLVCPWGWKAHNKRAQWLLSEVSFFIHEFKRENWSGNVTLHFQDGAPMRTVPAPSLRSDAARDRMLAREEEKLK